MIRPSGHAVELWRWSPADFDFRWIPGIVDQISGHSRKITKPVHATRMRIAA